MKGQITAWHRLNKRIFPENDTWEILWVLGLFFAALVLYCSNLGDLPLRDWDEGTVAQVAREIWQAPSDSLHWLFPTLWGEAYLNQPPLMHNLIALAYRLGGFNEWTSRLPGAILTALSVPLLYGLGREIFRLHKPALFSALIYLTWLPVLRHGRLAMLDGAVLCFEILLIWCVLRSRRDLRWGLGVGVSIGLLCLTKGIMGILLGAIALIFLAWDTPRILRSFYLWTGILLGGLPIIAWYTAQYLHTGDTFVSVNIIDQSLARIWTGVENHRQPPWYYLLELAKYGFPWLLFSLYGIKLAYENQHWSWAKLILVWGGVYFLAVSFMVTKLPWYIVPIYPVLALAGGAQLAEVENYAHRRPYPKSWKVIFVLMAIATTLASLYFGFTQTDNYLVVIFGAVAITMAITAMLIEERDTQFILVLTWGCYVSLLLFVNSPYWNWELNEAYPVTGIGSVVAKANLPKQEIIYTSFDYERPSLNLYSKHRILPPPEAEITTIAQESIGNLATNPRNIWFRKYWQESSQPYLLLDEESLLKLDLPTLQILGRTNNWLFVTKENIS